MSWKERALEWTAGGVPAVLVTVAEVEGSAPREPGARLVVTSDDFCGNIGGGNLEHTAIEECRRLLSDNGLPKFEIRKISLGPSLGQCCGGRVTLVYERLHYDDVGWLTQLARGRADGFVVTEFSSGDRQTELVEQVGDADRRIANGQACMFDGETNPARPKLVVRARNPNPCLMLFGAGHVGKAIVRVLADAPIEVIWIDSREGMFPDDLPDNVERRVRRRPAGEVGRAPPGALFLVMTHDHGLDQDICETALRQNNFTFFGLIGSSSKRQRFCNRLTALGVSRAALNRLICPIGIPGITGKRPEQIAIATAAQLLQEAEKMAPNETENRHAADLPG